MRWIRSYCIAVLALLLSTSFCLASEPVDWTKYESVVSLQDSPFAVPDSTPAQLQDLSVSLTSISFMTGGSNFGICTEPGKSEYYNLLVQALALGAAQEVEAMNDLYAQLNRYVPDSGGAIAAGDSWLEQVGRWLRSAQMKAVRARDGKRAKYFYDLHKRVESLQKVAGLLSRAGTIRDALQIVITCSQPLKYYEGAELGLTTLREDGKPSVALSSAMDDCLGIIRQQKNNFLVNLQNNLDQIAEMGLKLAEQILADNKALLESIAKKYLGANSVFFINDFFLARQFIHQTLGAFIGLEPLNQWMKPTFTSAKADIDARKDWFTAMTKEGAHRDEKRYLAGLRVLLLIESIAHSNLSEMFSKVPRFGVDLSAIASSAKEAARACLEAFKQTGYLAKDELAAIPSLPDQGKSVKPIGGSSRKKGA